MQLTEFMQIHTRYDCHNVFVAAVPLWCRSCLLQARTFLTFTSSFVLLFFFWRGEDRRTWPNWPLNACESFSGSVAWIFWYKYDCGIYLNIHIFKITCAFSQKSNGSSLIKSFLSKKRHFNAFPRLYFPFVSITQTSVWAEEQVVVLCANI